VGQDVFSPTYHKAFATPRELCVFIAQLRDLSGGKPVGFKICIGDPREFMAIVKAMIETGTFADFVVVDGGEGGTGAAPLEFSNAMGSPLIEALLLVQGALVGAGIRDRVHLGASGKMVTAGAITGALALGADWCNSARAFMMSVGCIQAQRCHTNRCPVGVTTQDKKLQRALNVPDKAQRVHHFHRNTVHAVAEMVAAMGLDHPTDLRPDQVYVRGAGRVMTFAELYELPAAGDLLAGVAAKPLQTYWDAASADSFRPHVVTAGHV
jgi:glutamate synthase domain-containing protein 2